MLINKDKERKKDEFKPDFSPSHITPFMVGVYLGINAIKDAFMLVEGPDCTNEKTEFIYNHDYLSNLTSATGFHRLANTALHPDLMALSREDLIETKLTKMALNKNVNAVFLTSMPLAYITGADYNRICHIVQDKTGKPMLHIPGKSLANDWIGGYREVLLTLAKELPLEHGKLEKNSVGIVGYLFDRNEEDHNANVREIRKMVKALGLNLVSIWLSGQNFNNLKEIERAETIISLPYAGRAARKLARRTGARVIELPLPFGPDDTETFIKKLAKTFSCEELAEKYIEDEMKKYAKKVEWLIPLIFQGIRFAYIGDPYLFEGFRKTVETVGGEIKSVIITNLENHIKSKEIFNGIDEVIVHPTMKSMIGWSKNLIKNKKVEIIVGNSEGLSMVNIGLVPIYEFGFPSYFRHALYDNPFMGFAGFTAFLSDIANQIRMHDSKQTDFETGFMLESRMRKG